MSTGLFLKKINARYASKLWEAVTELPLDALSAVLFAAIVHEICGLHARRERGKD